MFFFESNILIRLIVQKFKDFICLFKPNRIRANKKRMARKKENSFCLFFKQTAECGFDFRRLEAPKTEPSIGGRDPTLRV